MSSFFVVIFYNKVILILLDFLEISLLLQAPVAPYFPPYPVLFG